MVKLMEELKGVLAIDRSDLDTEVIQISQIWHQAAEQHVMAVSERDELKLDIKETHATLDAQFRRKLADEKFTEAMITHSVTSSEKMKGLNRQYLAACLQADLWEALRDGFNKKNDQLRNLVKLYSDSNFMTDSMGKERSNATDRKANKVREETGRMRRNKKGHDDD